MVTKEPSIMGLQNQITSPTDKLQDLQPIGPVRPNVWCTHYLVEGHVANECPRLRGIISSGRILGSLGSMPTTGLWLWDHKDLSQGETCKTTMKFVGTTDICCGYVKYYKSIPMYLAIVNVNYVHPECTTLTNAKH